LQHRRALWPWFVAVTVLLIALFPVMPKPYGESGVLLTSVGGLWALAFYLHGRHAEDARFMKELLTDFNARYNQLNGDLQSAIWRDGPFTEQAKLKFIDYFNLCAEEWIFRKAGYIFDPVWTAWENGMKQYGKDQRVNNLWLIERAGNSYYGFEFPTA
jgi:hypothetical protein